MRVDVLTGRRAAISRINATWVALLTRGDAIWLPAGMRNQTGSPEGSVGVPVGDIPAREARFAGALPMPTDPLALAAARDVLRGIASSTITHTARRAGTGLDAAFRRETGMPLRSWEHMARMRAAADMNERGMSPSSVARRVGYAHLSNFSRAFLRFHGVPPTAALHDR
ncbi:helix-turn-helix domain-containing protein [Pseudonocardia sp. GCM10023141]|uniref:helix-turn-helix domain-containing protein n=1 Tax=Pseudonocardia sp. GCM10023141 TaxID=3252653 RepID=UPI003620F114